MPIEGSTQLAVAPVDRPPGTIAAPQLEPTVARAVAFLRERAVESIAVADIADAVGYSEFHFTRLFTGALGVSPGRYLAAVRFQRAKELLLTGDAGVLDVCHAVGFASTGTFTRRFTDHVGVAPASLRRVADRLAGPALTPFSRHPAQARSSIEARVHIPDELRPELGTDPLVWVGLFPRPVPSGQPAAGVLRRGDGPVRLPAVGGSPWLLVTAVRATADPLDHLVPVRPVIGGHPTPVRGGQCVTVWMRHADPLSHPLLIALASMAP